jgi:hypothetical protein
LGAVDPGAGPTLVLALAIDATAPDTLYAGVKYFYDCNFRGCSEGGAVFKSTDGGGTWGATALTNTAVQVLAIDPTTPGTLYAGTGGGVFKSRDGAATWHALNVGLSTPDVWALAIDPTTPGRLWAGTQGGGVFGIEQLCVGDCHGNGSVSVDELVRGVEILLGNAALAACTAIDVDGNGRVTVDELVLAVSSALNGCT